MLRRIRPTPVVPPTELVDLPSPRSLTFPSPTKSPPELPQSIVTTPASDRFPASIPPDAVDQSIENLAPPTPNEDATVYPDPLPLAILILGISLSAFLVALARTRPCRQLSPHYFGSDAAVGSSMGWYTVCVVKRQDYWAPRWGWCRIHHISRMADCGITHESFNRNSNHSIRIEPCWCDLRGGR